MNPPPIQWLPVFAVAAEHSNFRKAADILNVSPPAVSQQIKLLEEYLGISLFKRRGPRLELTEAGQFYYESIQPMVQVYRSSYLEFDRKFNKRLIQLNTPLLIAQELLIPNYMSYKRMEPRAELRISTGTEYINFDSNSADAAIRFGTGNWHELQSRLLCKVQISPVCSEEYAMSQVKRNKTLKEQVEDQVLLTTDENIKEWRFIFPDIKPKEIIVCDSYFSVIKSAQTGIGIAMGLFPAINSWVNNKKLRLLSNQLFYSNSGYWFICPKQSTSNPLVQSCYNWSKELFQTFPTLKL